MQVRGNTMVATFDGVNGEDSNASTCLKTRYPDADGQGVDIYSLNYDAQTAKFDGRARDVHREPAGRRAQLRRSARTARGSRISNCCSDWAIDVVDLRGDADASLPRASTRRRRDDDEVPGRRRASPASR